MRELEPKMRDWLLGKLKSNGLAQDAIKRGDARLIFCLAMESCVGIYESGGNNSGPMVELIQKTLGGAVKEPWCMALVQTCLAFAEDLTETHSPIYASEHCMTTWRETPATQRVRVSPARGAIVIWKNGASDSGHTGIFVEPVARLYMKTVEGNSSGDGSRDGDCVGWHERNKVSNGSLKVMGFLRPF